MIFDNSPEMFESEKERNLYYKFFAGYFFNELIPDYEKRLSAFCSLFNHPNVIGASANNSPIILSSNNTHVSFDNHLYLFSEIKSDRGEFADILIHDHTSKILISIEVKLHSNWSFKKDITSNQNRLNKIANKLIGVRIEHVLLILESKWRQNEKIKSSSRSNYVLFQSNKDCRSRIIFWESFLEICPSAYVSSFLKKQLKRNKKDSKYKFYDSWFKIINAAG
ncbi:MAG: hypothetical protein ABR936_16475 [Bacteroidota bacterium]|jgi:hypothetical protein